MNRAFVPTVFKEFHRYIGLIENLYASPNELQHQTVGCYKKRSYTLSTIF